MRALTAIGTALRPLFRRPVRTLLLLQGTVWGVAVAVFPSAVIEGTRQTALERGSEIGADCLTIAADPTALEPPSLTREDVDSLSQALEGAGLDLRAVGGASVLGPVAGQGGRPGTLVAGTADTPQARGLHLASGRWLTPRDPSDVCVVEAGLGVRVGEYVSVERTGRKRRRLRVVGVARPQGEARRRTNDLGFDVTHPLYDTVGRGILHAVGVPFVDDAWKRSDAVAYRVDPAPEVEWIFVRVTSTDVKKAAEVAEADLLARGRSAVTFHPLVLPFVMGEELDRFRAVQTALFLACLSMGAIVMANLGLLTVLSRNREIAIRRVEGATRLTIGFHFLLEGLALTAVGCVVGCVLGMALAALRVRLSPVTGFSWAFPWQHAAIAVGVAMAIGVLAALLPAMRAARRDPIAGLVEE